MSLDTLPLISNEEFLEVLAGKLYIKEVARLSFNNNGQSIAMILGRIGDSEFELTHHAEFLVYAEALVSVSKGNKAEYHCKSDIRIKDIKDLLRYETLSKYDQPRLIKV